MEIKPLTYKWLSALMCYPESDLLEALPELQAALGELPELKNNPHRAGLDKFLDHLASHTCGGVIVLSQETARQKRRKTPENTSTQPNGRAKNKLQKTRKN